MLSKNQIMDILAIGGGGGGGRENVSIKWS